MEPAEHGDRLAHICEGHRLGRGDDEDADPRQSAGDRNRRITGTGRQVHDQIVELAPADLPRNSVIIFETIGPRQITGWSSSIRNPADIILRPSRSRGTSMSASATGCDFSPSMTGRLGP